MWNILVDAVNARVQTRFPNIFETFSIRFAPEEHAGQLNFRMLISVRYLATHFAEYGLGLSYNIGPTQYGASETT